MLCIFYIAPAYADEATYAIVYANHSFEPFELVIPAGKECNITIKNQDGAPFSFRSGMLHQHRVIQSQSEITVYMPALNPGTYRYYNDFDEKVRGYITAK